MAGPRPKDQLPIQHIRVRFIITAMIPATARSLVEHFIRLVHPISRRPIPVNIFLGITAQALFECWIPLQLRPVVLSPAHHSQWTFKWEMMVVSITLLVEQAPL